MKRSVSILTLSALLAGSIVNMPSSKAFAEDTTVQNVTTQKVIAVSLGDLLLKAKENNSDLSDLVKSSEDIADNVQSYNRSKAYLGRSPGSFLGYTKSGPYYNYIIPIKITPLELESSQLVVENAINKLSFSIDIAEKQKVLAYHNSKDALLLSREAADLAKRKFEILSLLYNKGLASKNEYLKAEIDNKSAAASYINAQHEYEISKLAIAKTMNFDATQEFTVEALPKYTQDMSKISLEEQLNLFYESNNSLQILRKQRTFHDTKLEIAASYKELMYESDYLTLQYNSIKNTRDYSEAIKSGKINIATTVTSLNNMLSQFSSLEKQIDIVNSQLNQNDIKTTHKYGHDYAENELKQNLNRLNNQKLLLQTSIFMSLETLQFYVIF